MAKYDVIVWGATSFVGQLVAEYMFKQYGADGDVKWAMGGRSAAKLETVKKEYGIEGIDSLVGDASDEAFMNDLVQQTKVVCSTVGPYALYGNELVAACAKNGTDYVDLTGEPQWIRKMIDTHHAEAVKSGARIVHSCGFDSIPSDMGVAYTQQLAQERFGTHCNEIGLRVRRMKGGASGGTIASMMNVVQEARENPALMKILKNPFALAPEGKRKGPRQPDTNKAKFDDMTGKWIAPFIMASINTRNVHRSNAIMDYPYGEDFLYGEATIVGKGLKGRAKANVFTGVMGGLTLGMAFSLGRKVLGGYVLPKPGEGPSKEERENGCFDLWMIGKTANGDEIRTHVTGDRDPGYGSTAKMLSEAAICLAQDVPDAAPGMGTPAATMGNVLRDRLVANAGLTFSELTK